MSNEFPQTYLPGVARAADRAMQDVLDEDHQIARYLGTEVPAGLQPRTRARRRS